jgi:GT2 family glycosyltransferase
LAPRLALNGSHPGTAVHTPTETPARDVKIPRAPGGRPWKIAAVIPCFNRRADLELLLKDVARQDILRTGLVELWCTVIDNASTEPLSTISVPPGIHIEFVRLPKNTGGSGGFNAGMSHVLSGQGLSASGPADMLWWLDSDARVHRACLRHLLRVLVRSPKVGAVGSALCDVCTGDTWEIGGEIDPRHGSVWPAGRAGADQRFVVRCKYLAACSALVRRVAIEKAGLFPENFIYYDDVDWCIQMTAKTGLRVVGAPRSRAYHPPGNRRYVTWARYYIARNCFSHMDVLKMGGLARFRRAMREVPRAVGQAMMGLPELGELHLRGLKDALDRNFVQIEPRHMLATPLKFVPFKELGTLIESERAKARAQGRTGTLYIHPLLRGRIPGLEAFRKELKALKHNWPADDLAYWGTRSQAGHAKRDFMGVLKRFITGPNADVALTPTGWPNNWLRGRVMIQVTSEGLLVREVRPMKVLRDAISIYARGIALAFKLANRGAHVMPLPAAPRFAPAPAVTSKADISQAVTSEISARPQATPAAAGV